MNCNNFDIVVIGGGLSGICASIASSRAGKRVALISNRPVLGGNSSSEIRVWTRGSAGAGNLFSEEMGILGQMKLYNEHINPEGNPVLWDEVLFDFVFEEKNITLFLNTLITEVEMNSENQIIRVGGFEITSENKFEFYGKMFVDATGDGFIGVKANVPYVVGKEDKKVYNEAMANDGYVKTTQGNSILFFTKTENHKVPFIPPKYAYKKDFIEKLINNGGRVVNENSNGCDLWWVEFGGELDTIKDYAQINLEDKRLILGIFDYIKNSKKFDADNLALEWVGNLSGKRESRRFLTDYVLTSNDVLNETKFNDVAFYGGWFMDFHPSKGIYSEASFCEQIPVHVYEIPFRCLYNSSVSNLFFAGRNIGTSNSAFASSRVMNTCALSGQSAGTLASVLIDSEKTIKQIDNEIIEKAQQILIDNDNLLLHKGKNQRNLLKNATVTTCDTVKDAFSNQCGALELSQNVYLAIPSNLADKSKIYLVAKEQTEISISVFENTLPHSKCFTNLRENKTIKLQEGENIIALAQLFQGKEYLSILLNKNDKVSVLLSDNGVVGVNLGYVGEPKFHFPLMKVESFESYDVSNLFNGFNRPYQSANAWVSEKVPCEISIKFEKAQQLKNIEFAFNPELSVDLLSSRVSKASKHHGIVFRNGTAPQIVKDFEIYAKIDGKMELIKEINDNYQRIVNIDIDVVTEEMAIKFKETYGAKRVEVFEIKLI